MRNNVLFARLGVVLMFAGCASVQTHGGIAGVLAEGVEPELVQEGFIFTEGTLGMADGGLYFTDLRANRIYRLDVSGKISVFRENTNGTNGLAFTPSGDLVGAEGARGKRISKISADGKATELTVGDGEKPFMAPNDLFVDAKGGIYFTDPGQRPVVPGRKAYVYYLPAGSTKALAIEDGIVRPNGLTLTLDGKTLIVADSISGTLFAFDVQPNGTVRNKRPFIRLRDIPQGEERDVADGIAIDRAGRFYVTTLTSVQVFDKMGEYLGAIRIARKPSNLAFSGPGKRTLYITAGEGLYRLPTLTQGPERLGK
jgi:gluconolactonase